VIAYTIDLSPITALSDEQFDRLCAANPEINFERTISGELVIWPPSGGITGNQIAELTTDFGVWNEQSKRGEIFGSSTCFRLPGGGVGEACSESFRSPDVSWIEKSRWDALTPEQQRKFPPICPDFVLELRSPIDNLRMVQQKMQEYLDSGIRLGWLINPEDGEVEIYRPGQEVEVVRSPKELSGEDVLLEFVLNLEWLWK
jgi:Uma2 family endonuclease